MARRFVVGDVHGCFLTLKSLLFEILDITKKDEVYFLGDYVDRGPSSKEVLDLLIALLEDGYKVFPLMGNHEFMMLGSYYDESMIELWFENGGGKTLLSMGIRNVREVDEKYIKFLKSLKKYYLTDNFVLVHAGLNFNMDDPFEDEYAMLWARNFFVERAKIGGRRLIGGHTPTTLKDILQSLGSDRIFLDGGCVYKGRFPGYGLLCALDLDTMELFYKENID